jgi:hypothetical protein
VKTTKYRIVELRDRPRLYVTNWMPDRGSDDFCYEWCHDVRKATVFGTRAEAMASAERIEARIRAWRAERPTL